VPSVILGVPVSFEGFFAFEKTFALKRR